jgi:hypothetical protein
MLSDVSDTQTGRCLSDSVAMSYIRNGVSDISDAQRAPGWSIRMFRMFSQHPFVDGVSAD